MKILEKKENKPCINSIGQGTVLNGALTQHKNKDIKTLKKILEI